MTRTELNERIKQRMHQRSVAEGVKLVDRARVFAIKAHGDQKYGEEPYSVHLEGVETILIEFNHISSVLRASAWLHDVLEDTKITPAQLYDEFPGYVFLIVEAVTSELGKNRKERNTATYPKIAKLKYAVVVKLADRIQNVRKSLDTTNKDSKLGMYQKEYPAFRAALYDSLDDFDPDLKAATLPMWWALDRLLEYNGV